MSVKFIVYTNMQRAMNLENSNFLRDELQDEFTVAFKNEDMSFIQSLYGKLRILNRQAEYFETESVDITDLAENICLASDILLNNSGKSVIFCGNDVSAVLGNRQILTKAILEAISNACIFGKGGLITVKTQEHKKFVTLEVQSMGAFKFRGGDGLSFMRKAVRKSGGEMLIVSHKEYSATVFKFKKSGNIRPSRNRSFIDLVSDRLSPVFIELYGV